MIKLDRKKSKLLTTAKVIGFAGIMALASPIKVQAAVITDEVAQEILEKIENDTCTDEEFLKLLDWMQEENKSIKQETQELKQDILDSNKEFNEQLNSLEIELENLSMKLNTDLNEIQNETDEFSAEIEKTAKAIKRELVITQIALGVTVVASIGGLAYSFKKIEKTELDEEAEEKEDVKVFRKTYE